MLGELIKAVVLGKQGNGMFPERRMSALEQDSGRVDIRTERSQGRRSERSRGNMPFPCLWSVFRQLSFKVDSEIMTSSAR